MVGMGKKKPKGGKHKTERVAILIPEEWDKIAQRLATEAKQPKMWHIIDLLKREAEEKGITDLPPVPWDKDET